jgi:ribonuclease HI
MFDGHELGTGPLPPGAEDSFDDRVLLDPKSGKLVKKNAEQLQARRKQPTNAFDGPLKIYTDGSSRGNGRVGAVAGVGVFFGPGDDRYAHDWGESQLGCQSPMLTARSNVSEPLQGPRQTNQRAELKAIHRAVELSPIDRDVIIYSDSHYSIQCVTVWFQSWRSNGWLTSGKKPVENRDLIELAVNRIEERYKAGSKTEFVWVKGHSTDAGNIAADRLAVDGAIQAARNGVPGVNGD